MPFFLIWVMIGILPFYIAKEGYDRLQTYGKKRGWQIGILHIALVILVIVFVILWTSGFR
jgi:hypothetical protein